MHIRVLINPIKRTFTNDVRIGLVSVPFNRGQEKKGVSGGPDAIKNFGLVQQLKDIGRKPFTIITIHINTEFSRQQCGR